MMNGGSLPTASRPFSLGLDESHATIIGNSKGVLRCRLCFGAGARRRFSTSDNRHGVKPTSFAQIAIGLYREGHDT